MNMKMDKPMKVAASACDHRGIMAVPAVFALFMDMASEHGTEIGLGSEDLGRSGLFWLTVRTKVRIFELPSMMDDVVVSTWPEKPGRIRCNRYYTITAGEKVLVEAKTEWAMMDMESGKIQKMTGLYPEGMEHCPDVVCEEPFARFSDDFGDAEVMESYKVRSTDIDFGHHMNNAAYVKVLFGAFSCKEQDAMNIKEVEIAFKAQSYEGDVLSIHRRQTESAAEYGMIRENGEVAAILRILC